MTKNTQDLAENRIKAVLADKRRLAVGLQSKSVKMKIRYQGGAQTRFNLPCSNFLILHGFLKWM